MNKELIVSIENRINIINRKFKCIKVKFVNTDELQAKIDNYKDNYKKGKNDSPANGIYEYIINYIISHNDTRFLKKNGKVNESAFYEFVPMQKESWYKDIKNNTGKPPGEKIMLRLVFALKLSTQEARDFLRLGGCYLTPENNKYCLVLSLLDTKTYNYYDVYEAFEYFGKRLVPHFENIY